MEQQWLFKRTLGCGFLEAVYKEALEIERTARGILTIREEERPIFYGSRKLSTFSKAGFVCFHSRLVEMKALTTLDGNTEAQILNDLKASGLKKRVLLNFGTPRLQDRGFVYDEFKARKD